jgi:hypothetical protein
MKFGLRKPSLNKRIAARTSVKRIIRHNLGLKAPRGWGWITNPKRAAYNRVYNRTSRGCMVTLIWLMGIPLLLLAIALFFSACSGRNDGRNTVYVKPSIDYKGKFRKGHIRRAVSTRKDAVKSQNRSRYYYQTRGKYRRKDKKY